jgi:hypothetical protein
MAKKTTTNGRRPAPGRSVRQAEVVAPPEERVAPSDPQEFDFLPRREGHVLRESEIDARARAFRARMARDDQDAGVRAWLDGDALLEMYNGFAERAKGMRSFSEYARLELDLDGNDLRECLRIRRGASQEDARRYGRRRLSLGLRLMKHFGLQSYDALCEIELPQPDGTTIQFPAPTRALQAAIRLLEVEDLTPSLEKMLAHRKEALKLARVEYPELEGLRMRYVARDGDIVLEPGALGRKAALAMARVILRLEGKG